VIHATFTSSYKLWVNEIVTLRQHPFNAQVSIYLQDILPKQAPQFNIYAITVTENVICYGCISSLHLVEPFLPVVVEGLCLLVIK
jgi:hypothetical protein